MRGKISKYFNAIFEKVFTDSTVMIIYCVIRKEILSFNDLFVGDDTDVWGASILPYRDVLLSFQREFCKRVNGKFLYEMDKCHPTAGDLNPRSGLNKNNIGNVDNTPLTQYTINH